MSKFVIQILSVCDVDLPYCLYYQYPKGRTLKFKCWAEAQAYAMKKLRQHVQYKILEEGTTNVIDYYNSWNMV